MNLRGSLFARYSIPLVVLVSVALVISGLVQIYFSYQENKSALARIQHEKAAAAAIRIEQFVRTLEHDLSWIAQTAWGSSGVALDQRRLDSLRLLRQAPAITEVSHIDPLGHEQLRVSRIAMDTIGSNEDVSGDPGFVRAMTRETYFSPIYFRKESEPYMTIAMAGAAEDAGVVIAEANLKFIWDVVSNLKVGKGGNAYVVDEQGRLIAHPDISVVLQKTDLSMLPQVRAVAVQDPGESSTIEAMVGHDLAGTDVLSANATIAPLNWTVFVDLPIAEAFAPLYASILRTVLLVLAGVAVSTAASLFLVRRMVSPIQVLREGAARIGAGALDHRIAVRSGDELEALADEFNAMTERLRDSRAGLERKVEERTRDLTETLEQQTAIADILRAISSSPADLESVLVTVAHTAARLCAATDSAIYRVNGGVLRPVAATGNLPTHPIPIRRTTVTGRAVLLKSMVHVSDILDVMDSEYPGARPFQKAVGYRTILASPLLREGVAIGAIIIRRTEVLPFTDRQIALLQTFADQAIIAIENARLFEDLQLRTRDLAQSVKQLRSLSEVSQAVNSTLDLQEVLPAIVTRAVELSGADGGVVYEYEESGKAFLPRATHGFTSELVKTVLATPLAFDEGATGRAATLRAPVQIPDMRVEGAYEGPLQAATMEAGVLAVLAVPLLREGRILGSLVVSRNTVGEFPKELVEVLQTFAAQSTQAIQNARLFREIEQKSRELESVSQHKSDFLANMSHELRTPLNAVIGFSEVLEQKMFGELNDKQLEYVRDIHDSGRHLLSLINDILDLSKIEAGKVELDLTRFDLPNTIEGTLTLVRERAIRHGLEMSLSIDEHLGEIEADERKVRQILLNLLSNAVKFTPDAGRIGIVASVTDGVARISVTDTGIGIAPVDHEAIFEEFRQVGAEHDGKHEGTGLGLTLARKFVELHGGRIWLKSAVGQGATFTFTLPMVSSLDGAEPETTGMPMHTKGEEQ
ncbi:MAG TPA: ATP-binding protein [Burkholderiales bacterium]|nr:ATP-binding protein [Burkholderiales bacterium]